MRWGDSGLVGAHLWWPQVASGHRSGRAWEGVDRQRILLPGHLSYAALGPGSPDTISGVWSG